MKTHSLISRLLLVNFALLCAAGFSPRVSFAAQGQAGDSAALIKQVLDAKCDGNLEPYFEALKKSYFKNNEYAALVEAMKQIEKEKSCALIYANYYLALSRYEQLKFLEEKQNWDEYFSNGNTYRDEITSYAQKVVEATKPVDALHVRALLLLWQFHEGQQDVFAQDSLSNLAAATQAYAKEAKDPNVIREVADALSANGKKAQTVTLYKAYAEKLVRSDIKDDELKAIADNFYKEGNVEVAQNLYDMYIERISAQGKDKVLPLLIGLAKAFAYKDEGSCDPLYAESLFAKVEEIGGKEAFNEELIYLRAFNLEKIKEYAKAKDIYAELLNRYPNSAHADEAIFKSGIIYTYVLRDVLSGKKYFEKLAQKSLINGHVISSLYQLGLLNQWQEELEIAKSYYTTVVSKGADFAETVAFAQARLKEIKDSQPIEYNLKTFLDCSLTLTPDNASFDMSKSAIVCHPYNPGKASPVKVASTMQSIQSGCMQVDVQNLWSGDVGAAAPSATEGAFTVSYDSTGTKFLSLVIVSPSGIVDRNIDLVDVR